MGNLPNRVKTSVKRAAGSAFWKSFEITSSDLTTSAQDLTGAVHGGNLAIEHIILLTDGTGLAGATNFELSQTGSFGPTKIVVESVANLGANVARDSVANAFSDTNRLVELASGAKLQYLGTSNPGTGAGKLRILVKFRRLDDNADVQSAV